MTDPATGGAQLPKGKRSFRVEARSTASPAQVWPLIGEAERWKEWSFLDRSDLVRDGAPDRDGVGAIRRFTRMGVGSTEEVVVWDPPHHLGYAILSGFPVRHYRADVVLAPEGTGTRITWSSSFDEQIPGTGSVMTMVLRRLITGFARGAARYAEHIDTAGT
jgi:hypothetical protein